MRIKYKCLVPIYVFPEIKLIFPKQNYNVLSPSSYAHTYICERFIYFQVLFAYSAAGKYVERFWEYFIYIAHRYMNVEFWTEAALFPIKEYINGIFLQVWSFANWSSQWWLSFKKNLSESWQLSPLTQFKKIVNWCPLTNISWNLLAWIRRAWINIPYLE